MVGGLNFGRLSKAKVFRFAFPFGLGRILLLFDTHRLACWPAGLLACLPYQLLVLLFQVNLHPYWLWQGPEIGQGNSSSRFGQVLNSDVYSFDLGRW